MTKKGFKYLIRDRDSPNFYLQNDSAACYSSDVGTAIYNELPAYISEKGDCETEVIRSDTPEFWNILKNELQGELNLEGLHAQISDLEWELSIKMKNRDLIIKCIKEINGKNDKSLCGKISNDCEQRS